jgi:hypothetical protein
MRLSGDEPIVVTMRPGWMTERAHAAGLPVWIVPQRAGLDALWVPRFAWRLRRERIDVLHSHEFAMNVYGGVAAARTRRARSATTAKLGRRATAVLAYRSGASELIVAISRIWLRSWRAARCRAALGVVLAASPAAARSRSGASELRAARAVLACHRTARCS